jgi:hypothetical protein
MSQQLIPTGERSGLQTQSAATLGASLCTPMKNGLRFWNLKRRFEPLHRDRPKRFDPQ